VLEEHIGLEPVLPTDALGPRGELGIAVVLAAQVRVRGVKRDQDAAVQTSAAVPRCLVYVTCARVERVFSQI
jgi:hypothetical protein